MVVLVIVLVLVVLVLGMTTVFGRMAARAPASRGPHYDDLPHHHPSFQDEPPPGA